MDRCGVRADADVLPVSLLTSLPPRGSGARRSAGACYFWQTLIKRDYFRAAVAAQFVTTLPWKQTSSNPRLYLLSDDRL